MSPPEAGLWLPALKADTHKGCPKGVGVRGDPDYSEVRTGTRLRRTSGEVGPITRE